MRTKKDGVVESRYAYALRESKVTEKADPFSKAVAALRPREIFEVDGTYKDAKAYLVVLRDGRRGWAAMDPNEDMAPIFKRISATSSRPTNSLAASKP